MIVGSSMARRRGEVERGHHERTAVYFEVSSRLLLLLCSYPSHACAAALECPSRGAQPEGAIGPPGSHPQPAVGRGHFDSTDSCCFCGLCHSPCVLRLRSCSPGLGTGKPLAPR